MTYPIPNRVRTPKPMKPAESSRQWLRNDQPKIITRVCADGSVVTEHRYPAATFGMYHSPHSAKKPPQSEGAKYRQWARIDRQDGFPSDADRFMARQLTVRRCWQYERDPRHFRRLSLLWPFRRQAWMG